MMLTGNTASVERAGIMTILAIFSQIVYKKSDTINNLTIALWIILLKNPFKITSTSLILSFGATIGIICFLKNEKEILIEEKIPISQKLYTGGKEIVKISFACQIIIIPLSIIYFNKISLTFFFSNLIVSPFIGLIIALGFICSIPIKIPIITNLLVGCLNLLLKGLITVSEIFSEIPISHIYVINPGLFMVILYYLIISIVFYIKYISGKKPLRKIEKNILIFFRNLKNSIYRTRKKLAVLACILILAIFLIYNIPQNLEIHFLDVGQGDCMLVITPNHKTILIDGGTTSSNYDIGKQMLLPYLLNHKIAKIDAMVITHFDADHCNALSTILEEINVKKVIVTKQNEISEEFKNIAKIISKKKIQLQIVKKGDEINFYKDLKIRILYPNENLEFSGLNNNSIVMKLEYEKFSMITTGDIEKEAEQQILKDYKGTNTLKSVVLKVPHHGSNTSTTQEFLEKVQPKIALIGVGENNNFGHPSKEVINRLQNLGVKVYRTDEVGEISIVVNRDGKIKIKTQISN